MKDSFVEPSAFKKLPFDVTGGTHVIVDQEIPRDWLGARVRIFQLEAAVRSSRLLSEQAPTGNKAI